jgi:predicted Zn-dependent peptidase
MNRHQVEILLRAVAVVLLLAVAAQPSSGQKPDRSAPPKPGPAPALKLAAIQHFTLKNGLPVVLLEKHEVPLVQINLLVRTGSVMDPAGKSGLAGMVAAMMTEGAGSRSSLQLADAIDFLGARIASTSDQHSSAVRLHTPLARLDSALALFADVILRPAFPPDELDRKRKQRLTSLLQWRDEPRAISSVIYGRTLYTDAHPYGRPAIGTEATLRSFRREDLQQFHGAWFRPNNSILVVVGDVTPVVILPKLEAALGTWKSGDASAPALPAITQVQKREIIIVDKPGAPQTEVRIGRVGVPRLTGDYYAIVVMNTILGGSFSSRLNQNLREQHGYTYGANSRFDFRPLAGPFTAGAAVQTAVTDKALTEFMKELNGILKPVPDAELERARNYVALKYPGNFQTVDEIAGELEEMVLYGLPDDFFNTYVGRILAVTKDDVQRVAKKYLDPEKVAIVLVGDRKAIEGPVSGLNLGPVRSMTIEDVLGKAPVLENPK